MNVTDMGLIAAVFFTFALLSKRLAGTALTPPILFTGAGLLLGQTLIARLVVSGQRLCEMDLRAHLAKLP